MVAKLRIYTSLVSDKGKTRRVNNGDGTFQMIGRDDPFSTRVRSIGRESFDFWH